jgi:hypothetical protein
MSTASFTTITLAFLSLMLWLSILISPSAAECSNCERRINAWCCEERRKSKIRKINFKVVNFVSSLDKLVGNTEHRIS